MARKHLPGLPLLPTTTIGSYPRPRWLRLAIQAHKQGRITAAQMEEAFDDAVVAVVREHEEAGLDILWDGEMRRDEMTEYFASRLDGFRYYGPVRVWGNNYYNRPAIVGEIRYRGPMLVEEFTFLRSLTRKPIKVPITGAYTIADWSFIEHYDTREEAMFALARALNRELKELVAAGANYIQIDEPAFSSRPEEMELFVEVMRATVRGVEAYTGMHSCYGDFSKVWPEMLDIPVDQFALEFLNNDFRTLDLFREHELTKDLGMGCVDAHTRQAEPVEQIAKNIERGIEAVGVEKVFVNPDCGLKLLPRDVAREKTRNMVAAARSLREKYA